MKHGWVYIEIGTGNLQTDRDIILNDQQVIIYQAETGGHIWVRPTYEFISQFERVI